MSYDPYDPFRDPPRSFFDLPTRDSESERRAEISSAQADGDIGVPFRGNSSEALSHWIAADSARRQREASATVETDSAASPLRPGAVHATKFADSTLYVPQAAREQIVRDGLFGLPLHLVSRRNEVRILCLQGLKTFVAEIGLEEDDPALALRLLRGEDWRTLREYRTYDPLVAWKAGFDAPLTKLAGNVSEGARWCYERGQAMAQSLAAYRAQLDVYRGTHWLLRHFRSHPPFRDDAQHADPLLVMYRDHAAASREPATNSRRRAG